MGKKKIQGGVGRGKEEEVREGGRGSPVNSKEKEKAANKKADTGHF